MYKSSLLLFFSILVYSISAITITGKIIDDNGLPLPFVSVYVEGSTNGTTSNMDGEYFIKEDQRSFQLIYKFIGYKTIVKQVKNQQIDQIIDIVLPAEVIGLEEVTIEANGLDPAYPVIRGAMKKRKVYLKEVEAYQCDVYVKGSERILDKPEKFMGYKVTDEMMGILDTQSNIVSLSESESKFYFKQPRIMKDEMISSKVSGDNSRLSWNGTSDVYFNLYEGLVEIYFNERGLVSPIAPSAMLYYKYKLLGSFYENGQKVYKIKVIPKRKIDPVFKGELFILDESFRIHSADLIVGKGAQIDFVDSVIFKQVHVPVNDSIWMPMSNTINYFFKMMGFKGEGYYTGVSSNYMLNPVFPKRFFKGELIAFKDGANDKDSIYWESSRPVVLTDEEHRDYKSRDSIHRYKTSRAYLDSVDSVNARFKLRDILLGYSKVNTSKKRTLFIQAPIQTIEYNTVQGFVIGTELRYSKWNDQKQQFWLIGNANYGIAEQAMNGFLYYKKRFDNKRSGSYMFKSGDEVVQFNRDEPITSLINSYITLTQETNYAKYYRKKYLRSSYIKEIFKSCYFTGKFEYANRVALANQSMFTLKDYEQKAFTSNHPLDGQIIGTDMFNNHNAMTLDLTLKYVIKEQYYTRPYEKIVVTAKYPTFYLNYRKGVKALWAISNYDHIDLRIKDDIDLKLLGIFSYNGGLGGFVRDINTLFIDYKHFNANQTYFTSFEIDDFKMLDYYAYSTTQNYMKLHMMHNFQGLILNKFPLIRKLKMYEVAGLNYLQVGAEQQYIEAYIGIEKLQTFRVELVTAFGNQQAFTTGIRIGLININNL